MPYAYSNLACPGWSVQQMIDAAKNLGYEAIELRLLDGEVLDPVADRAKIIDAIAQMRANAVEVCALDTSARLYYRSPTEQVAGDQALLDWISLAHDVRVPLVRVFGGATEETGAPADDAVDGRCAETLRRAAPAAERAGVELMLETHDTYASAKRVANVLSQVASPAVGTVWDVLHTHRLNESPAEAFALLQPWLLHAHIKDAIVGADRSQWEQTMLGAGEVPLDEVLSLLKQSGYDGYLTAEWEKKWHPELAEPEVALPQHLAWMRERE